MHTIQNDEDHVSEKIKSCFFLSIRYRKTSQTQDVKSQITERSVRKIAQPKRDSAFEQETRFVLNWRSEGALKTGFLVRTKEKSPQELKKHFWNVHNVVLESFCFAQETKAVFISIRYPKTSQTQELKSEKTKPNLRKLAQPKRDSAFEQKTRIVPKRETSGSSQNIFFSYNQRKKQSRAQTDFFGTYSASFWKIGVFLSVKSPNIFRKVLTKIIKTFAHNKKRRRPRFRKKSKAFFYKYSVSQDNSHAGCKEPKYQM